MSGQPEQLIPPVVRECAALRELADEADRLLELPDCARRDSLVAAWRDRKHALRTIPTEELVAGRECNDDATLGCDAGAASVGRGDNREASG